MKHILFALLLFSGVASAQFTPTGSKTRFVNGIGLGSKIDAAFGTADSLVLYTKLDSTLMFKYKGTARALAYANQLPNDSLGVLVRLKAGTSAGVGLYANNWTQVAQLGAGGSSAATFYGFAGYNSNVGSGYTSRSFTDKGFVDSSRALDVQLAGTQTITGAKTFSSILTASSRLNVNGATDNGVDALNVTGKGLFSDRIQASYFKTNSASASIPSITPTTIFSASANGRYEVYAFINGGNATNYAAIATVITEGGTSRIIANNATYLQLSLSGTNVQATHQTTNPSTVAYSWLLITN